ncbi:hypothetical protein WN51_03604 [Melipona quadrifasciata]|uniref:Uncharacterized protein n=1 Tax=Melipona quadrifasciata TaxID=166423 RepID=A0A0M8ZWJ1_9HYME|nr:hypothetical protein WN51_03604 [Melipona quadrifasciata]
MGKARVICIVAHVSASSYVDSCDSTPTEILATSETNVVSNATSVATTTEKKVLATPPAEVVDSTKIAVPSRTSSTVPANAKYISVRRRPVTMLLAVIALLCAGSSAEVFTNTFLVKMRQPAERHVADRVAARNGFVNLGPQGAIRKKHQLGKTACQDTGVKTFPNEVSDCN